MIYTDIMKLSKKMLHRVIETLIEHFASAVDKQVQSVVHWTLGGLLQVLMEVEFLSTILEHYLSEKATQLFQDLYQQVKSKAASIQTDIDSTSLQTGLEHVKKTITDTCKKTTIQFMCFKQ